jgi:hypothetical protein
MKTDTLPGIIVNMTTSAQMGRDSNITVLKIRLDNMLPKKNQREGAKPRDKIAMDSFSCQGWLHITINDGDNVAWVTISHADDHVPYYSIDVPPDIVEYVHANHNLTLGEVSPSLCASNYLMKFISSGTEF